MIETPTPVAPAKGLLARAIGVITSPKATYEAVVANPKPFGILLLAGLVMGLAQGLPQMTQRGRQAAVAMQVQMMERFGQQIPAEAIPAMEERAKFSSYFSVPTTTIGVAAACLFFSAIFWAIFNVIFGGTASFKQVFAVVAHSQVIGALGYALSAPIMYAQGTMSMGGPFNLGILVPMLDEQSLIASVLGATSVFAIWGSLNTGTGLGVLFKRNGLTIGIVLIVIWLGIAAGVASILS